jgi:allantoin racemase
MARILTNDPNSSEACSGGLSRALEPFRFAGGPVFDVVTLIEGPPAIYTWRDWHSGVEPTCRLVERSDANEYVVACASDPGIEAMRTATSPPFSAYSVQPWPRRWRGRSGSGWSGRFRQRLGWP